MRRGLVIASYLLLSLLDIHKSVILSEHQIDLVEFGLNFINALALAKVMLVGQELNFARRSSIKRYGSHSRTQFYLHASKSLKWPLSACYTTGHLLKAWLASLVNAVTDLVAEADHETYLATCPKTPEKARG